MTAEDLYAELKDAIDHFGLRWSEKDKIEVTVVGDAICFEYQHRWTMVSTKKVNQ